MSEYDIFQIDVVKGYGMTELDHGLKDPKTCLMKCPMSRSHDIPLYRHPDRMGVYGCHEDHYGRLLG